jgi:hypothetical protein
VQLDQQAAWSLPYFFLKRPSLIGYQFVCVPEAALLSTLSTPAQIWLQPLFQFEFTGERNYEFLVEALFSDNVNSATGVPGGYL